MQNDDLTDVARQVGSRLDFAHFVDLLRQDFDAGATDWDNIDPPALLAGLAGFARDLPGYYEAAGDPIDAEAITWRMAAEMLLAATVYEG